MMIVDDPVIANYISNAGVNRLFVDLEYIGKNKRQKGFSSWKSKQKTADVSKIRMAAPDGHLMVRINPMSEKTLNEIDEVIARGADSIMLPMFRTLEELEEFYKLLRGRVEAVPLFETKAAVDILPKALEELPISRLHFGLNDLHLDLGNSFIFQPISEGVLEEACDALRCASVPFGIGGIARVGEGQILPELLLSEHVRLGSDMAILSRTFHRNSNTLHDLTKQMNFEEELEKLRFCHHNLSKAPKGVLEKNRIEICNRINSVVAELCG